MKIICSSQGIERWLSSWKECG